MEKENIVQTEDEFKSWYKEALREEKAGIWSIGQKAAFMAAAVNVRCKAKYRN